MLRFFVIMRYGSPETFGKDYCFGYMKREKILKKLEKALDKNRLRHTLGVEATAVQMAILFGEDTKAASRAALLHDCAKCMKLSEMQGLAKEEAKDPMMHDSKALLHAPAGAALAREEYKEEDEGVLSAIRWHTTGRPGMTRLEKIIYLADMIEPNRRTFPGLDELRMLCSQDLDAAMYKALNDSVSYVLSQGKTVHPDTLNTLSDYKNKYNGGAV